MVMVKTPKGEYYMDGHLSEQLSIIQKRVQKDDDRVFIVDGPERSGKSVLAMQLAAKVDPTFSTKRICFTPEGFIECINNADKYQAVVFDEAFTGLSSRNSLSRVNNLIVSMMMEMGQKNLFVFIVMPSIFFLERYIVLFRATGLFHVYTHKGKRGRWMYFDKSRLKYLYLNGKKFFSYNGKGIPKSGFKGRFLEQYVVDEKVYRDMKYKSLLLKSVDAGKRMVSMEVRDNLLRFIYENMDVGYEELSSKLKSYGVKLSPKTINNCVRGVNIG